MESYRWACGWAQLCHARGWVGKGRSPASPTPCALIHLTFLKAEPRLREECVAAAEHIWLQFGLRPSISQGLPFPIAPGTLTPAPLVPQAPADPGAATRQSEGQTNPGPGP